MRVFFLHGARYNIYFGTLYTSLSKETAQRDLAQHSPVRQVHLAQEIGLRAWENGIEALLAPSAAHPAERNLAKALPDEVHRLGGHGVAWEQLIGVRYSS
jgi:hypothetical protein